MLSALLGRKLAASLLANILPLSSISLRKIAPAPLFAALLSVLDCSGDAAGGGATVDSGPNGRQMPPTSTEDAADNGREGDESSYFYFTYDDSASVANVELMKDSLENNRLPSRSWGVPHEYLNYENFLGGTVSQLEIFQVSMGIFRHNIGGFYDTKPSSQYHELGVKVSVPALSQQRRKNFVLTFLVDISGSMFAPLDRALSDESGVITRIDLVKYGLEIFYRSGLLKEGDMINLVLFNHVSTAQDVILQNFAYSSANAARFIDIVRSIRADGNTNIDAGIANAYRVATAAYDSSKTNRVIILTDAKVNTGPVDADIIGEKTRIGDAEGIYFSGIGVGRDFNFAFLDQLTDLGKGSYFALFGTTDADRLFRERFINLIQVAARDVIFRLDYPATLLHVLTASEEISQDRSQVQTTNFSYGSSQFFIETFREKDDQNLDLSQEIIFTIEYKEPESGESRTAKLAMSINSLLQEEVSDMTHSVKEAVVVRNLAFLVAENVGCRTIRPFHTSFLNSYSSPLLMEYLGLIDRYCSLPTTTWPDGAERAEN